MNKNDNETTVEGLDIHRQIDDDWAKYSLTDCDVFVIWCMGLEAWQVAKKLGAKFPHE